MSESRDRFKSPDEIIKVTETFGEAYGFIDALAGRGIGSICMKGVAKGDPRDLWIPGTELYAFAKTVAIETKGSNVAQTQLHVRRLPLRVGQPRRLVTVHDKNARMHIDGVLDCDTALEPGEVARQKKPLFRRSHYRGAAHHVTAREQTRFVQSRLKQAVVNRMAEGNDVTERGVEDTKVIPLAYRGEAVTLEKGDYMAVHTHGVCDGPVYAHGTMDSSPDRYSYALLPSIVRKDASTPFIKEEFILDLVDSMQARGVIEPIKIGTG